MNLVKEYLGTITGVYILAIVSMLIFLAVFLVVIYHTCSLRKNDVKDYSRMPLEDEEPDMYIE